MTRSLRLYWKTGVVVAFGVAIATAVITGSLVVGDSVTASVRETVLARLGEIDHALSAPHFFRAELVEHLAAALRNDSDEFEIAAVVVADGAAKNLQTDAAIPNVNVIGIDSSFRKMFPAFEFEPAGRNAAVNETAARTLDLREGDAILVNVRRDAAEPARSMFARRERRDMLAGMRLTVTHIIPDEAGGGFSLSQQTRPPRNVFVSADWLTAQLGKPSQANSILASGVGVAALRNALSESAQPVDYGLKLEINEPQNYVSVFSNRMVFADDQVESIRRAADAIGADGAATSVYLADRVTAPDGKSTSYALLAGAEKLEHFEIVRGNAELASDSDILLNSWIAEDLDATVGGVVSVEYLVSMPDGEFEVPPADFTVRGIVGLSGSAADEGLVPEFEGITGAASISDWEPPFPLDMWRVAERDDVYWRQYRTTPKAFVSPNAIRRMWQSGGHADDAWVTSVRVLPAEGVELADLAASLSASLPEHLPPESAGLVFRPVRELAAEAAAGSQDFGMLFTSMGMFIVLSALGLAAMLMRLSVQQRASQTGTLLACGFTRSKAVEPAIAEGFILAALGALAGVPLGVAYAAGIIALLGSGWFGSIGDAAVRLHCNAGWLMVGGCSGLAAGFASTFIGARSLKGVHVLSLLAGWQAKNVQPARTHRTSARILLLCALALAVLTPLAVGSTAAFFVSGFALLVAGLCASYLCLTRTSNHRNVPRLTRALVSRRAASINIGRSMLAIGVLATAAFIIASVSAFTRNYVQADISRRDSGIGGFALVAVSSIPIPYDFGTRAGRQRLGFPAGDEPAFRGVRVYSLLSNAGDDVSCLNLAKPGTPRLIGVPDDVIERGGFVVRTRGEFANAWEALLEARADGSIPVFGDADSILWQLNSGLGEYLQVAGPSGDPINLYVAGLISESIFAGELLMSEENFRRLYPTEDRPRYFLIEAPTESAGAAADALRRNLGDMGLDMVDTRDILNAVAAVQNTYISTFIALGGLGVVLGSFGLVIVLLRSALESRGEFALMLAVGFSRKSLAGMLVTENGLLLVWGLAIGVVSAVPAILPQMQQVEFQMNWTALAAVICCTAAAGLISCLIAARLVVSGNLIHALREE